MAYIDQVFSMTPAAIGNSLSNVVLMLVHRHRRWNSIKTAPDQRLLILYGDIGIYNNIILQYMGKRKSASKNRALSQMRQYIIRVLSQMRQHTCVGLYTLVR